MRRLLASLLVLGACSQGEPLAPGLAPEPLPDDGRLPPGMEAMLFGSSRGCRDDADCESNACNFGACAGLTTVDEIWRIERIGERMRARFELQPELRPIVMEMLADVAVRDEMGLPFRGRSLRALGELYPRETAGPAIAELKGLMPLSPGPVMEVAALTLARLGDRTGLDIVLALTESERLPSACEALRAAGRVAPSPEAPNEPLVTLLSALAPEVDFEIQRAAIDGLAALADPRSLRPLAAHLAIGPESLADEIAAVLRTLTGEKHGPDPLAWDAWIAANNPPAPPPYTPRGHDSVDDIDLPTP